MIKHLQLITILFIFQSIISQEQSLTEKFTLPEAVKETSGLIFFNQKIITHNDSGDEPKLYEIDSLNGNISRVISITNATNIDWEDISQDENYIYVADIGNNNGNRQDLKIYKVLKSDYLNSTNVTAEIITYSYEDQVDFSSQFNNNNFDAEAITVYQNTILIFTKNWLDFTTNLYKLPTTTGNHIAQKISSYNSNGLITGVSLSGDNFIFSGYNNSFIPFLIFVDGNRPPGLNVFSGNPIRIDLIDDSFLETGSQIEGITFFDFNKCFISREFASFTVGGITFQFPQKLYVFTSYLFHLLSVNDFELSKSIKIVPNPFNIEFKILLDNSLEQIKSVIIYNLKGQELFRTKNTNTIKFMLNTKGVFYVKIEFDSGKLVVKKLVKN